MSKEIDQLAEVVSELVADIVEAPQADIKAYARHMAEDLQIFLRRRYLEKDENAEKDLKLLQAQARLLALKHLHRIDNQIATSISRVIAILAKFAIVVIMGI